MTNYIETLLLKYDHPCPSKPQHSSHAHWVITYGAKEQLLPDTDTTSPPLPAAGVRRIQAIVGSLLYYAQAVNKNY